MQRRQQDARPAADPRHDYRRGAQGDEPKEPAGSSSWLPYTWTTAEEPWEETGTRASSYRPLLALSSWQRAPMPDGREEEEEEAKLQHPARRREEDHNSRAPPSPPLPQPRLSLSVVALDQQQAYAAVGVDASHGVCSSSGGSEEGSRKHTSSLVGGGAWQEVTPPVGRSVTYETYAPVGADNVPSAPSARHFSTNYSSALPCAGCVCAGFPRFPYAYGARLHSQGRAQSCGATGRTGPEHETQVDQYVAGLAIDRLIRNIRDYCLSLCAPQVQQTDTSPSSASLEEEEEEEEDDDDEPGRGRNRYGRGSHRRHNFGPLRTRWAQQPREEHLATAAVHSSNGGAHALHDQSQPSLTSMASPVTAGRSAPYSLGAGQTDDQAQYQNLVRYLDGSAKVASPRHVLDDERLKMGRTVTLAKPWSHGALQPQPEQTASGFDAHLAQGGHEQRPAEYDQLLRPAVERKRRRPCNRVSNGHLPNGSLPGRDRPVEPPTQGAVGQLCSSSIQLGLLLDEPIEHRLVPSLPSDIAGEPQPWTRGHPAELSVSQPRAGGALRQGPPGAALTGAGDPRYLYPHWYEAVIGLLRHPWPISGIDAIDLQTGD